MEAGHLLQMLHAKFHVNAVVFSGARLQKSILQHFVASFGCYRPKIITYFCPFLTCLRHEILHVIHTQQGDIAQKILSLLALIFLKKTDLILVLGMVQNFQNFEFMLQKNYLVYHFEILLGGAYWEQDCTCKISGLYVAQCSSYGQKTIFLNFWTPSPCLRGYLCHFLSTYINEIRFENLDTMYLLPCQIWSKSSKWFVGNVGLKLNGPNFVIVFITFGHI